MKEIHLDKKRQLMDEIIKSSQLYDASAQMDSVRAVKTGKSEDKTTALISIAKSETLSWYRDQVIGLVHKHWPREEQK